MGNVVTGKMSKRYTKKCFIIKNIPCVEEEVTIDGDRKTYNKGCAKITINGGEVILNIYVKQATETHKVGGDSGDGKEINYYASIVGFRKTKPKNSYSSSYNRGYYRK